MIIETGQVAIVALVALAALLFYLRTRRHLHAGHLLAIAVFAVYLVGVAHYTILPLRFDAANAGEIGQPGNLRGLIGLIPFFLPGGDGMPLDQMFGNILLGVPFGFGLPFIRRMSVISVVAIGLFFSVAIESVQLVSDIWGVAAPTRSVDLNDVILNTVGVACGVLGFTIARAVYRVLFGRFTVTTGLWSHFHRTMATGID